MDEMKVGEAPGLDGFPLECLKKCCMHLKKYPNEDFFSRIFSRQQSKGARQFARLVNSLCVDLLVLGFSTVRLLCQRLSVATQLPCSKYVRDYRSQHSGRVEPQSLHHVNGTKLQHILFK